MTLLSRSFAFRVPLFLQHIHRLRSNGQSLLERSLVMDAGLEATYKKFESPYKHRTLAVQQRTTYTAHIVFNRIEKVFYSWPVADSGFQRHIHSCEEIRHD